MSPSSALRAAAVGAMLAWLPAVVVWGPLPHALTWDDAWYYFQIGRNVADGAGSTFDGFNITNGYHPLWLLVAATTYLLGLDGLTAVRSLLVLQLALWGAALAVLGGAIARSIGRWPTLDRVPGAAARCTVAVAATWFLLGANPYVVKLFVNGLETGLVAVLAAMLLALAVRHDGDPLARPVLATVLFALSFLARTDAVLVAGAALLWSSALRRRVDRTVLGVGASFAVVVVAYLLSNVALVGHPMQISGEVKRLDRPDLAALLLFVAAAAGVFGAGLRARRRPARLQRAQAALGATGWYGCGALLIVAYDHGLTAEVYLWHYAPLALWALFLVGHAVADLAEGAVLESGTADRALVVSGIVVVPLLLGGLWQLDRFVDPGQRSMQEGDRAAAEWIAANLPADAAVASYDAGVVGYFADRRVVNLDGLVNSYEWQDAREAGASAVRAFLDRLGVGYLANHGEPVRGEDPALVDTSVFVYGDEPTLVHRVDYVFCGSAGGSSGCRPFATFVYELPSPTGS